jgi:hypothetical protein
VDNIRRDLSGERLVCGLDSDGLELGKTVGSSECSNDSWDSIKDGKCIHQII